MHLVVDLQVIIYTHHSDLINILEKMIQTSTTFISTALSNLSYIKNSDIQLKRQNRFIFCVVVDYKAKM
jgi:hypothetical protein